MKPKRARAAAASRVAVVIMPFAAEREFRVALGALAEEAGYVCRDEGGMVGDFVSRLEPRVMLVCSDASLLKDVHVDRTVVVTGDAAMTPDAVAVLYGVPRREAVMHAAKCLALAEDLQDRGAAAFRLSQLVENPAAGLNELLDRLGLTGKIADPGFHAARLAAAMAERQAQEPPPRRDAALGIYEAPGHVAIWDRELFFSQETADFVCPDPIDITGRERALFYGPFLTLPAGAWQAAVRLYFSADAARRPYRLDFGEGEQPGSHAEFWPASEGDYEFNLNTTLTGPAPVQIRLWLAAAGFHGEVRLRGAEVRPLHLPPVDRKRTSA